LKTKQEIHRSFCGTRIWKTHFSKQKKGASVKLPHQISAIKFTGNSASLFVPEEGSDKINSLALAFKFGNSKTVQNRPLCSLRDEYNPQKRRFLYKKLQDMMDKQ